MADLADPDARIDRGAILVLAGLALTALMIVAALVVDLGLVRHQRRSAQSVADLSALAAGEALGAEPAPDGPTACADAVSYVLANEPNLPAGIVVPCSSLPSSCDAGTLPVTVTDGGTAEPWTISITYPVSDGMVADDDVAAPDSLRLYDGVPCERLGVGISRTVDALFAGIVGRETFSVDAWAVVRQVQAADRRAPSLWLLDPYGCPTLDVQGGSTVVVGSATVAGLITIDSDASGCAGNSFTVDVGGAGSSLRAIPDTLVVSPSIALVAMDRGQTDCVTGNPRACDPADVAGLLLQPQPIRRAHRVTRAPIDHHFNCKSGYPDYHGLPIDDCAGSSPPYVDQLRAGVGAGGTPAGFQRWTDSYSCNNPTVPVAGLDGNWHIDCATFKITTADVSFNGGNIVIDGSVSLTGGSITFNASNPAASLSALCRSAVVGCIDESAATAAWVFMRSGDLKLTGGALVADRTAIFQDDGYFSIAGGSPPVWSPPLEGPFTGLSVWSEKSSSKFGINGGASMMLAGTFFTPEAKPFSISGGAPVVPQSAQFVAYRLSVSGGASLTLTPNPSLAITLPMDAPLLIR